MAPTQFDFMIEREGDTVTVAMDCGGVVRSRLMGTALLAAMSKACAEVRAIIDGFISDPEAMSKLPDCPSCREVAGGSIEDICIIRLIADRRHGSVEFMLGFYDVDDESAPALLLVDQQIDDFTDQANALLL